MKLNWKLWAGIVLVFAVLAAPARALDRGLYLVDGTQDYYFIDETGTRHVVQNFDTVKTHWFATTPVITTKIDLIKDLPTGDVITETVGPDMVVKKTTTTTVTNGDGSKTTRTEESTQVK